MSNSHFYFLPIVDLFGDCFSLFYNFLGRFCPIIIDRNLAWESPFCHCNKVQLLQWVALFFFFFQLSGKEICMSFTFGALFCLAVAQIYPSCFFVLSVSSLWQRSDKPLSSLLLKISVPLTDLPQFPWLLHPFLVTLNILILRTHLIFLHLWCIFSSGDGGGKILSLS